MARHERARTQVQSQPLSYHTVYGMRERVVARDPLTGAVRGWGRVAGVIRDEDGYQYIVEGEGRYQWRVFFCRESELEPE